MLAGAWSRKGAPVRCKACVSSAEEAERAASAAAKANAAGSNSAAAETEQPQQEPQQQEQKTCASCSTLLDASAFSRSQLHKGDTSRCRACVSAAAAAAAAADAQAAPTGTSSAGLLSAAPPAPKGAKTAALRALAEPQPAIELKRLKKLKRLRRSLQRLCAAEGSDAPPILAFDRWMARCRLAAEEQAAPDPLLPSGGGVEPGLVKDLCRGGRLQPEAARRVAAKLAEESAHAGAQLACSSGGGGGGGGDGDGDNSDGEEQGGNDGAEEGGGAEVVVQERGGAGVRLSLRGTPKPYCDLSHAHFAKLRSMHAEASRGQEEEEQEEAVGGGGGGGGGGEARFRVRVLCLLLRYDALGAHGYQAALGPAGFELLRAELGCAFECFASPLNCRYPRFCSAFADTDRFFGSVGSFFSYEPSEGSFECNPPFVPEVMLAAVRHAEALLERAEARASALSFAFIVPTWEVLPFHQQLLRSAWRRQEPLLVDAEGHGYLDGAQHHRRAEERKRVSSFGSTVAVLQTSAGAARWPVADGFNERLREAFAAALPAADAADARKRRGGGDAVALLLERRGGAKRKAVAEAGETGGRGKKKRDRVPS